MEVIVVGAGLAGLAAANELTRGGATVRVFEASDEVGGRVRTDEVDGFLLDRGFQILLTGYPEVQMLYNDHDLCAFAPGALVRIGGEFHRVGDPLREPARALDTLRAPIGTWADKARILALRWQVSRGSIDDLWHRKEVTALQRLRDAGFSSSMIERFLRPLFAGITLDPELRGSSRTLEFVFRMLSSGDNAVPRRGMGQLATRLAKRLDSSCIHLRSSATKIEAHRVEIDGRESHEADAVIVATDMSTAKDLCGVEDRGWKSVTSVWFGSDRVPNSEPILMLNGEGHGALNSAVVMSNISPAYAPSGKHCVVATSQTEGHEQITRGIRQWFPEAQDWQTLRVDEIPQAQPLDGKSRTGTMQRDGVWLCGDYLVDSSINGALASGRLAARSVLRK